MRFRVASAAVIAIVLLVGCNPFAPELDEVGKGASFGDAHTVDGYFQAFQYAYQFMDTTVYGQLIAPTFTFSYRNYDRGVDVEWGRDDEMRTTAALFQSAQTISLLWGAISDSSGTATVFDVTRAFSLDITFNPGDIVHVDGRAIFHLERPTADDPWKAVNWRDESNL